MSGNRPTHAGWQLSAVFAAFLLVAFVVPSRGEQPPTAVGQSAAGTTAPAAASSLTRST